mmetsp:Transcript_102299/g.292859  ORF Transcript_102299/g.292859 Transcript_102299/m.292859 type:complete len:595 (+) Transcript_102299:879-2663(+)
MTSLRRSASRFCELPYAPKPTASSKIAFIQCTPLRPCSRASTTRRVALISSSSCSWICLIQKHDGLSWRIDTSGGGGGGGGVGGGGVGGGGGSASGGNPLLGIHADDAKYQQAREDMTGQLMDYDTIGLQPAAESQTLASNPATAAEFQAAADHQEVAIDIPAAADEPKETTVEVQPAVDPHIDPHGTHGTHGTHGIADPHVATTSVDPQATALEAAAAAERLVAKYRRFRLNTLLEDQPDVVWCPAINCGAPISSSSGQCWEIGHRRLTCDSCGYHVCASCGMQYHGKTRRCFDDDALRNRQLLDEFVQRKRVQPCPSCRRPVEKLDACPHMTCPCGHQWCWVCRQAHPCPGMHFGVNGSGSGESIGSVLGVQRAGVVLKIMSVICFLPFLALAVGLGVGVVYPTAILILLFLVLGVMYKYTASCGDYNCGQAPQSWGDLLTVLTMPFYAIALCLCLVAVVLAVPILMLLGALAFLPALFYLMIDGAHTLVFGHSSLDLRLYANFTGDSTTQYTLLNRPVYEGHLPACVWRTGRCCLAVVVAAVFILPGLAVSLALVPCAPVCLCPLFCSPRISLPKRCAYPAGLACGAIGEG